jgi:curli production assembly/transport component CsgG
MLLRGLITTGLTMALLSGCAAHNPKMWEAPKYLKASPVRDQLSTLPTPNQRIAVAVYGFTDQTGQFKPSDTVQTLSRAVTQGATSILVKTLQDTGNRGWFQVIEREKLDNVLRERAVIREMRANYLGEKQINPDALPPLLFAGVLLEGGIISYDSNTKTGGSGARFLGIGGSTQYREDTVTVYLRAVSVKTGEVLTSVSVRKSIAAVAIGANAFRFVDFKELLELETGITYNEPDQIALTQAIEKATLALIMEGALNGIWCMNTTAENGSALLRQYVAERDSIGNGDVVKLPVLRNGSTVTGACGVSRAAQLSRTTEQNSSTNPATTGAKPLEQAMPKVEGG